jgi:Ca2+/Na+ antiporter
MGVALFANMGFVAMFIIFVLKWSRAEELDLANEFSLLALVFFTFVSNGQLTYMGIVNLSMFLAVVERMSKVMQMEEQL